jgi:septal ring factor EnvC (AmiA/AmiB activator)
MLKIRILAGAVLCMTAGSPMQAGAIEIGWRVAQAPMPAQQQNRAPATVASGELQKYFDEQKALQKSIDDIEKQIRDVDEKIKKLTEEEQRMKEIFDKMAKILVDLMAMIGSDSNYMKKLNDVVVARGKVGDETATAKRLVDQANAGHARGQATLRAVEGGRRLALAQIKSNPAQAGATAAKHLDMVRQTLKDMEAYTKWDKRP